MTVLPQFPESPWQVQEAVLGAGAADGKRGLTNSCAAHAIRPDQITACLEVTGSLALTFDLIAVCRTRP